MKKIIITVLLLVNTLFSQDDLLQYLDGDNLTEKIEVLMYVESNNLIEYTSEIQSRIKYQDQLSTQLRFLTTLQKLGSPELESEILAFHQRINDFPTTENRLEFKASAAIKLFNCCNNYELAYSVVELAELNNIVSDAQAVFHLGKIGLNVEELRTRALVQLERLVTPGNNESVRIDALNALCAVEGVDYADELIEILENEPNYKIRYRALNLLNDVKYQGFKDFLKENISQEPDTFIRKEYLSYLFGQFGEPTGIKFIIEYRNIETNTEVLSYIEFGLEAFSPQPKITSIIELSDSLLSYCDQLFQFGWITDYNIYQIFRAQIEKLNPLYSAENISELCSTLVNIMDMSDKYDDGIFLIEEAHTFLFYYTRYIKKNVETEFGDCP